MELTALQDHQPDQVRGSGTLGTKSSGWHKEQNVQEHSTLPTVGQGDVSLTRPKLNKIVDVVRQVLSDPQIDDTIRL